MLAILFFLCIIMVALCQIVEKDRHGGSKDNSNFPYLYKILPDKNKMFAALQGAAATFDLTATTFVRQWPEDYMSADFLSCHFTEPERMNCRVTTRKSPMESWREMSLSEQQLLLLKGIKSANDYFYEKKLVCNIFNPAFAAWIILKYGGAAAKVIDPSTGWGDRLIGAIVADVAEYEGNDPNKSLTPKYKAIIKSLANRGKKKNYHTTEEYFENKKIKHNYYDLAFTSPPYFLYEEYEYSDNAKLYENWLGETYRPYLKNMIKAVKPNGYIAIYIENIYMNKKLIPLEEDTKKILNEYGATFVEKCNFIARTKEGKDKPRPLWVFRKIENKII